MGALAVIPCRMAATRLPGKPLLLLDGRPIIRWVHDATVEAGVFDEVVVATPDREIIEAVEAFGGHAMLTSAEHETGTDRVAEVAAQSAHDVLANVQGDQPFVDAAMLRALVAPFADDPRPVMTTVAAPLDGSLRNDPNTVKVVRNLLGDALYFSRSPIPYERSGHVVQPLHHIGLYAFDRPFLATYARLVPGRLEQVEGLEQLRVLEHGYPIRVATVDHTPIEINTEDDLARAEAEVAS